MKTPILLATIFLCIGARAQKPHTITLSSEVLSPEAKLQYHVVKVIDGRKDKSSIGLVQKGIANRLAIAVPKLPIEQEVMGLISRSGAGTNGPGVILRIEYLTVSELTRATSEIGKAEVTFDLFRVTGDSATFVARKAATTETRGMEVTARHPRNLADAIEEVLLAFNDFAVSPGPKDKPVIAFGAIADYGSERLSEINAPIFSAESYPDGLYASFEEFRDNTPSITDGYEVKDGDPLKARWVDNEGKKTRVRDNVYAIAHANRLYIFFDGSFYQVEKTPRGLFFNGPVVANNNAIIAGGIMGGMIGGAIAGAATARKTRYWINLSNGSLKAY